MKKLPRLFTLYAKLFSDKLKDGLVLSSFTQSFAGMYGLEINKTGDSGFKLLIVNVLGRRQAR